MIRRFQQIWSQFFSYDQTLPPFYDSFFLLRFGRNFGCHPIICFPATRPSFFQSFINQIWYFPITRSRVSGRLTPCLQFFLAIKVLPPIDWFSGEVTILVWYSFFSLFFFFLVVLLRSVSTQHVRRKLIAGQSF